MHGQRHTVGCALSWPSQPERSTTEHAIPTDGAWFDLTTHAVGGVQAANVSGRATGACSTTQWPVPVGWVRPSNGYSTHEFQPFGLCIPRIALYDTTITPGPAPCTVESSTQSQPYSACGPILRRGSRPPVQLPRRALTVKDFIY